MLLLGLLSLLEADGGQKHGPPESGVLRTAPLPSTAVRWGVPDVAVGLENRPRRAELIETGPDARGAGPAGFYPRRGVSIGGCFLSVKLVLFESRTGGVSVANVIERGKMYF